MASFPVLAVFITVHYSLFTRIVHKGKLKVTIAIQDSGGNLIGEEQHRSYTNYYGNRRMSTVFQKKSREGYQKIKRSANP